MALFNKEMATELAQKISENSAELFPTNRDAASSRRSYNAWEAITEELNSQYGSSLTIAQCRDKFKNLKKEAKKQFSKEKKYSVGTGGGPCINKKNDTIFESMVSTFGNSASFKGTPGALTTPLFKGDRLASSSSLAFDFSDDENETSTPKVKRSRPSVLSESDLRRKLLEKELKYLEKKTEFFDINHTGYRIKLEQVPKAITACAVLHNIATDRRLPIVADEFENDEIEEENQDEENNLTINERRVRQEAVARRNNIASIFV